MQVRESQHLQQKTSWAASLLLVFTCKAGEGQARPGDGSSRQAPARGDGAAVSPKSGGGCPASKEHQASGWSRLAPPLLRLPNAQLPSAVAASSSPCPVNSSKDWQQPRDRRPPPSPARRGTQASSQAPGIPQPASPPAPSPPQLSVSITSLPTKRGQHRACPRLGAAASPRLPLLPLDASSAPLRPPRGKTHLKEGPSPNTAGGGGHAQNGGKGAGGEEESRGSVNGRPAPPLLFLLCPTQARKAAAAAAP